MNAQTELPDDGPGELSLACWCRPAAMTVPADGDLYDVAQNQYDVTGDHLEIGVFATNLLSRHAAAFRAGLVGLGCVSAGHSTVIRVRVDGFCDWVELQLHSEQTSAIHPARLSFGEGAQECIRMVLVDASTRRIRAIRQVFVSRQLARRLRGCRKSAPIAAIVEFCPSRPKA